MFQVGKAWMDTNSANKNLGGLGTVRSEKKPFRKIGWLDNADCHKRIKDYCKQKYSPQVTIVFTNRLVAVNCLPC